MQLSPLWRTKSSLPALAIGALLLAGTAQTASAQLLAYEGFNYAAGTDNLGTQNGGTGFSGAWGTSAGTESVAAGSLGYTDGLGNSLVTAGNSAFAAGGATANSSDIIRTLSGSRGDGTTTWISFVADRLGNDFYWAASLQFRSGNTGATTEKITVGEISENNASLGIDAANNWWGLFNQAGAGATTANTADGYSVFNQSFFVLRVDNNAGATDTVRMWINPTLNSAPVDANAQVTLTGLDLTFDRVRIFARNGDTAHAAAQFALDELRLGGTFADVTPYTGGAVPEPSTYAAFGAGALLLLAFGRRLIRR